MSSLRQAIFALLWYSLLLVVSVNGVFALGSGKPLSAETLFKLEGLRGRAGAIVQGVVGRLEGGRLETKNNAATRSPDSEADSSERMAKERSGRRMRWTIPSMKEKPRQYARLFQWAAETYGVEKRLIMAVMRAESSGDPLARSHEGALGLMQLMPSTAQRYVPVQTTEELYLPMTNVSIGASHLAWLSAHIRERFPETRDHRKRQVQLIAAAYNAGLNAVLRYGGIPPYPETQGYVRRVWRWYRRLPPSPSS